MQHNNITVKQSPLRIIKKVIWAIVVVVIFYYLIRNLIQSWQDIPFEKLHFDLLLIIGSCILFFMNYFVGAFLWKRILSCLKEKISFWDSFGILGLTLVGKYLPGKVWFTLGRVYFAKRLGVREEKGFLSVAIEIELLLLSSLAIFVISPVLYSFDFMRRYLIAGLVVVALLVVILYPVIAQKLMDLVTKLLKRPKVTIDYNYFDILMLTFFYAVIWLIYGFSFYLFVSSFYPMNIRQAIDITGVFAISWNLGFIALFAPAGLGVREGIMTLLLSLYFPKPVAIIMSLLSRLWITVCELIYTFISLKLMPRISKGDSAVDSNKN